MPMANNRGLLLTAIWFAGLNLAAGCVSIANGNGLEPPVALCSHFRATVGCPDNPVPCGPAVERTGHGDASVMVKEWAWSGVSADLVDMAIARAAANGGLTQIYYADYELTSYLGFVTVFDIIVYGK